MTKFSALTFLLACIASSSVAGATADTLSEAASAPESTSLAETTPAPEIESIQADQDTKSDRYNFLRQQISTGEANIAAEILDGVITELEDQNHRYHDSLVTPLTLLGDAKVELGELTEAVSTYDRARHIARVNDGLFSASQIDVLYRESDALRQLGDISTAAKREEYAYEVANRSLPQYSLELIPPLVRLSDFYIEVGSPLSARSLLNRAMVIHEHHQTNNSLEAVPVLKAIAASHRFERFPAIWVDADQPSDDDRVAPGLRTGDLDNQVRYINSFPRGERALQQVVTIYRAHHGDQAEETIEALLALADWHHMFERSHAASTLYQHVYLAMEDNGNDAQAFFAEPTLLYFPRPPNPDPPKLSRRGDSAQGEVRLSFGVNPSGRVRSLKTEEVVGPRSMNFRVRRSMRVAIFRPRMEAGVISPAPEQTFVYQFPYFELKEKNEPKDETS